MLQEATKILNSAFHNSFIKSLSLYLHDCVREEVKSSTFRNLKQDKDNKWIFLKTDENKSNSLLDGEKMFVNFPEPLKLDGSDRFLTELMIQTEMSQKDKYLIYGFMFLVGKSGKGKRQNEFLTPLLYAPCKLERSGVNINCVLQDEVLSLNTGALTALMNKNDDEDEMECMLDGLLEVVPDLPMKEEQLQIFLTTLRSLIPDIEVEFNSEISDSLSLDDVKQTDDEEKMITYDNLDEVLEDEKPKKVKLDKVSITTQSAIILTKRPDVTAGVLHELTQISEKPSGIFRETALGVINEEYMQTKGKILDKPRKELKDFVAVTPLSLSDSQADVIKKVEENPLVAVYGPPGTGKSQTIVNLVAHLIANGKTVLVASKMDKATDVIADRLNELTAPYLALRAGRMNYQKQLSFDLQDLISNKVDLDTGFEDSILVDIKDMEDLLNNIKKLEDKCESIIKLEKSWHSYIEQYDEQVKIFGEPKYIKNTLTKQELINLENSINAFEKHFEKSGFFSNIQIKLAEFNFKKMLNLGNMAIDMNTLETLKQEVNTLKFLADARNTETEIYKIGNIHNLTEQIHLLKRKQKKLAIEILRSKRREALKGLLRDQVKRQRLIVHTKALVERKKNLQNRLLEDEDFKPLLEAFPCWCVTTYAVSGSLPMKPGLFDVAIIDEASQCDIASCFPILFRAKKAVIVGDDKQLPHLSFLEKAKEQSFLSQYNIPDKYQLMWRFRTNSMFDLANYYSTSPVLLDEHFRSYAPIVEFSNKEFYGSRMRVMSRAKVKNVLELVTVPEGKVDFEVTRNVPECEAIMQKLHEIILNDEKRQQEGYPPVSIGIVSPFRGQVELIKKAIAQVISDTQVRKHRIEVGTAHAFQGDERDIMLVSWTIANNSFSQSLMFLQKANLFNVAITRAKKKQYVFLSKDAKSLPDGLLRDYIEYIQNYKAQDNLSEEEVDENVYKNKFERTVANALREGGLKVVAGVDVAGFSTDLTVSDETGNTITVELDGVEDTPPSRTSNMKKQAILERSGLKVIRLSFREWYNSQKGSVERIKNSLIEE
ncbi:AAA family ATPase [bacterium]|nr:AAA family ATPase [bacterium]